MKNVLSNNYFNKIVKDYVSKKEKYSSRIIKLLLKNSYSKIELINYFNSKPTFYTKLKSLKQKKVIDLQKDKYVLDENFKKKFPILECYFNYIFMIKTVEKNNTMQNQVLQKEMVKTSKELEKILGFK
jgi:hypothetical protein